MLLNQDRLKEVLQYQEDTGEFTWLKTTSNRAIAGSKAGSVSHGYISIRVDKKRYFAHRLAWLYVYGKFPSKNIDHIDCNSQNNAISNLREASQSENLANIRISVKNTSGYKGVHFHKGTNKWRAVVSVDNKPKHLGLFSTATEASNAYNFWCLENRGEFARINK